MFVRLGWVGVAGRCGKRALFFFVCFVFVSVGFVGSDDLVGSVCLWFVGLVGWLGWLGRID